LWAKWNFTPRKWYYRKKQHIKIQISHKRTDHDETKQSTQRYINNKGHNKGPDRQQGKKKTKHAHMKMEIKENATRTNTN
jgi:hypothetical protein